MMASIPVLPGVRSRTWLARNIVAVVLATGCFVMALLAFEQDRTISTQRDLIHSLVRDSIELNALKIQRQQSGERR